MPAPWTHNRPLQSAAARLDAAEGIALPHISLDEGRVRLLVRNGVALMTVRVNLPLPGTAA